MMQMAVRHRRVLVLNTSPRLRTLPEATDPSNPYFGLEAHGMEGVLIYKKNGETSTPIIHRAILPGYRPSCPANPDPIRVQME